MPKHVYDSTIQFCKGALDLEGSALEDVPAGNAMRSSVSIYIISQLSDNIYSLSLSIYLCLPLCATGPIIVFRTVDHRAKHKKHVTSGLAGSDIQNCPHGRIHPSRIGRSHGHLVRDHQEHQIRRKCPGTVGSAFLCQLEKTASMLAVAATNLCQKNEAIAT